jgi:hypothetical protein
MSKIKGISKIKAFLKMERKMRERSQLNKTNQASYKRILGFRNQTQCKMQVGSVYKNFMFF